MKTVFNRVRPGRGLVRVAALGLLALGASLLQSPEAHAQWVTNGTHITNTNSGGVGVGTMNPAQNFHVHSPGTWSGTRVTTGATGGTINDGVNFGYDDHYGAYIWNRETTPLIFSTSNVEKMRLTPNGFLGIGTTAPTAPLTVNSDATVSPFVVMGNNSNVVGAAVANLQPGSKTWAFQVAGTSSLTGVPNGSLIFRQGTDDINAVVISPAGRFGVGTGTPAQALHVRGKGLLQNTGTASTFLTDRTDGKIASFGAGGSSATVAYDNTGVFKIESNTRANISTGTFGEGATTRLVLDGNGNMGVGVDAPTAKLHVAGNIVVDGNINAKYQDVAEWVPSTQKLSAGTVVVLDTGRGNHVLASHGAYDTRVAGVISAQPGLALGEKGEGKVLVATTGRVKVRVDATRAPIKIGDLIVTSEVEGVAMKSLPVSIGGVDIHRPGTLIGKALESLEKGTGEILVLLSLQ